MAEKSAIQRIKELDEERAKIFDQARQEALEKAEAAVVQLNGLGLTYRLVNGAEKRAKGASPTRRMKAVVCPICEFQTDPPHDGRTHRNQKKKASFSAAELKEKGLTKV